MHFQTSVSNWDQALLRMPDWVLVKSVNDGSLLVDAYQKWTAAGRDPSRLFLDYRHHDLDYTFSTNWDLMVAKWRMNFSRFIDGTYLEKYAPYIKLIEELNEYTDTRMVTDKELLAPRLASARAAVWVWNNEYRGRTLTIDNKTGTIPDSARLVVCNSPVGNDIPIEFYELCRDEDAVLGVRTYTKWLDKQRDSGDFRWHSGRPFFNEQEYGIKVDYVLGETGPYNGSTLGGWRHSSCMGADRGLLIEGMRDWIRDMASTAAYQEGRILGPGAWFTSSTLGDQWGEYRLWDTELKPLADMCAVEWKPGTSSPPPPPPPPPPSIDPGLHRDMWDLSINYQTISLNTGAAIQTKMVADGFIPVETEISTNWEGVSYVFQAGEHPTDFERRVYYAELGDWDNVLWVGEPGSGNSTPSLLGSPVDGIPLQITWGGAFGVPRDYSDPPDGIKESLHGGIDLVAIDEHGQPVPIVAVEEGTILWASDQRRSGGPSKLGNHVIQQLNDGRVVWYGHLSTLAVQAGYDVFQGDFFGLSGTTGNSSAIHLHFTVQKPGGGINDSRYKFSDVVDPAPLLGI
jgi:hypothetical protein